MNELITGLNGGNVPALDIIMLLTFAALLPSIVVMMSSFMRIIIILSFTRNAMGVQQTPPNMVLTGMALFLSLYIMSPVIGQINTVAYEPYKNGEITQQEAVSRMADPLKQFMLRNTEKDTLDHFVQMSKQEVKKDVKEYPLTVVVPAFMTSELKKGFLAGFLIYLPFLLIDIVVSTTLMSMGMVMLPPTMVSLPFKLLLFITVNGWELLFSSLVQSFREERGGNMTEVQILDIMYEAFQLAMKLSLPFLLISMIVGVVIAVFQAATQINEQTMTFVPKLLAIMVLLGFLGSSMLVMLQEFFQYIVELIAKG